MSDRAALWSGVVVRVWAERSLDPGGGATREGLDGTIEHGASWRTGGDPETVGRFTGRYRYHLDWPEDTSPPPPATTDPEEAKAAEDAVDKQVEEFNSQSIK